jgi:hypothetical protein
MVEDCVLLGYDAATPGNRFPTFRQMQWLHLQVSIGKGKVHPRTGHEGSEGEYRYSSTLSLTSTLDGGGWSTPRPGRFTTGKETRYPLYRKLGTPQGRSERVWKISPPPVFDPRTVQLVASRYTGPPSIYRPRWIILGHLYPWIRSTTLFGNQLASDVAFA